MAIVKNFLGQDLEIPEDRFYIPAAHFWFRVADDGASTRSGDPGAPGAGEFEVGTTEPGVALTGGLVELDVLVEAGAAIVPSEEVAFATTRKAIKYFMSPVGGAVTAANPAATADAVNDAPYDTWLFRLDLSADAAAAFVGGSAYAAKLAASEHATSAAAEAAAAAKAGKASPTCRSIYTGIKE